MDSKINRDISGNSLRLSCDADDYRIRMLEYNRIPGLLDLAVREEGERIHLEYDISSLKCIRDEFSTKNLTCTKVRNFVRGTDRMLRMLKEYFLDSSDIVLSPEMVYVDDAFHPCFCCYPGNDGDFAAGLSGLLRELLSAVDPNDHDAVVLTYNLFQVSCGQDYVVADLLKVL